MRRYVFPLIAAGFMVCVVVPVSTSTATLTVQSFDNCAAWNNMTGSGYATSSSNPLYDSGPNSLCGGGDGWAAYSNDIVGAGMASNELLVNDPRCWQGSNCLIHRFGEGKNPPGGGAAKFTHPLVNSAYYAYNWKYSTNSRWRTGDPFGTDPPSSRTFTPDPSHFKQIDINDLSPTFGPRFLQELAGGRSCTRDVNDSNTQPTCNLLPNVVFRLTKPDTWYCTAVFVDIPNHIIQTWSDMAQPGVMQLLQDQRVAFASMGQNKIGVVQLHTNMGYAQGDNNPTTDDNSTNAGLSMWFADNFVAYEFPPATIGCASTAAGGGGVQAPSAPTNLRIVQGLHWLFGRLQGLA